MLQRGDPERARILLREVLDAAPQRATAWAAYGAVLDLVDSEDQAARAFARGLELHPGHHGLRLNLARFHLRHGRYEEVARILQELRRQDPEVPAVYQMLADLARSRGREVESQLWTTEFLRRSGR